jgi:pentatricopeptide repeat protein
MKILSKWKDYYDFMVGKYGMDPLLLYDRRNKGDLVLPFKDHRAEKTVYYIAVCDMVFRAYCRNGKFLYGSKAFVQMVEDRLHTWDDKPDDMPLPDGVLVGFTLSNVNRRFDCPVVVSTSYGFPEKWTMQNPKLSLFDFGKVVTPEKMWMLVSEFLSREKHMGDSRTDKMKKEARGFDDESFKNTNHRLK